MEWTIIFSSIRNTSKLLVTWCTNPTEGKRYKKSPFLAFVPFVWILSVCLTNMIIIYWVYEIIPSKNRFIYVHFLNGNASTLDYVFLPYVSLL